MWYSSQSLSSLGALSLLDALPEGILALDKDLAVLAINRRAAELLGAGQDPESAAPRLEQLLKPDAVRRLARTVESVDAKSSPSELTLKFGGPLPREFTLRCLPLPAVGKGAVLVVVKETPDAQSPAVEYLLLEQLLNSLPDKIYFKDLQSRFLRISRAHAHQFGLEDPREAIGKTDFDFFSEEHAKAALEEEREIIRTGRGIINNEQKIVLANGREGWASTTKLPLYSSEGEIVGTFGVSRDITGRKQAEAALVEERNLLRTIIDILPSRIFVKDAKSHFVLNNKAHLQSLGVGRQEDALAKTSRDFYPEKRGEQALSDDRFVLESGNSIIDHEKSDFGEKGKTRWAITTKVPLRDSQGQIVGLVGMSHDITARKNAEEALRVKNEEMEADLKMAREIQQALLTQQFPTFPRSASPSDSALRFCQRYRPASTLAGDFFDVFAVSDTEAGILICDVMGHGVRAALITAFLRGLVEEIMEVAGDPGRFLGEVNRNLLQVLNQAASPMFATVFYCVADIGCNEVRYANAGHPSPFLLRREQKRVERLRPELYNPEPALGLVENFSYGTARASLSAGDVVLLFTDGIFEVPGPDGGEFGEERLLAAVKERIALSPERLLEGVLSEANRYAAIEEFPDDVCLLTVETAGGAPCDPEPERGAEPKRDLAPAGFPGK